MKIIFLETGKSFEKALQPHGFHKVQRVRRGFDIGYD